MGYNSKQKFFKQMSYQPDLHADELSDAEFLKKYKGTFYKTSNSQHGKETTDVKSNVNAGLNGKFTSHLMEVGMYHNNSLQTTCDRDRYINGSKDWMDKLS